jgi:NitT/TauT family transport system substrate-binding protein
MNQPALTHWNRKKFGTALFGAGVIGALPRIARADTNITVATLPIDPFGEPYYAEAAGLFKAGGLNVQITPVQNSSDMIAAMVAGSAQFALVNLINFAEAVSNGVPLVLVAPGGLWQEETARLVVAKNSPYQNARDLNGKIVGVVGLKNFATIVPQYWMDKNGGDGKSLKFVEIGFGAMIPALQAGRIDAAFHVEPFLAMGRDTIRPITASLLAGLSNAPLQAGAWAARPDWASANTSVVRDFSAVIVKAATYANQNPAKTAVTLAQVSKMDPQLIAAIARSTFATRLDVAQLQPLVDLAARYGALARPVPLAPLIFRA